MTIVSRREGVKIRFDGKDAKGKITTRSLLVADANIDEVVARVRAAIDDDKPKAKR